MSEIVYNILRPWETLDPWQKEYIDTIGIDCFLLTGRQSGKSTAMSIKGGELAVKNNNFSILILALTEKQAFQLFFKTLMYLQARYPKLIKQGLEKPTKHEIKLKNGSIIRCHATGLTGDGLRGFTVNHLMVDEASNIADEVFTSIQPMMSVTKGTMDIASTPAGKEGFFYECSLDDHFKKFYISAEDCPRHDKEFLERQKERMSEAEYAKEYLAKFMDEFRRVFSDELINKICVLKRDGQISQKNNYFCGIDVGGLGKDDSVFAVFHRYSEDDIRQVNSVTTSHTYTTETSEKAIELHQLYNFRKIGVDNRGIGFGVYSELLKDHRTKRVILPLDNASKSLDRFDEQKTQLLREDMYMKLLAIMEQKKVKLLDDDDIIESLKSVLWEHTQRRDGKKIFRVFASYNHPVEAIIRGVWLASQKHLKLWVK